MGRTRHPPRGAAGADAQHLCGHKSCPLNPRESIFCRLHHRARQKKVVPRLRECCRQSQAEEVSNSSEKIHQTWRPPFVTALYTTQISISVELRKQTKTLLHDFPTGMLILAANPKLCERICILVFFPFLLYLYSPEPSELRKARKIVRTNLCYLLCPWELGRDCLIWIEGNDDLIPTLQNARDFFLQMQGYFCISLQ